MFSDDSMNSGDLQPWHSSSIQSNISDIERGELEDTLNDTNINEITHIYSEDTGSTGSHSPIINCSVKTGLKCLYINADTVLNEWSELEC